MNPREIMLVQSSWSKVTTIQDAAAQLFYRRLFELDPALEPLFKSDMEEQRRKLMRMITTAVNGLGRLDEIVSAVQNLGRRHVDYGVKDAHYDTVGAALLWTLGQGLGKDFTPEVEQAWEKTYHTLASTMKEAAATTVA